MVDAKDLIMEDGEELDFTITTEISKDREQEVLVWFDAQPKNEDGSVTIEHGVGGMSVPPEIYGITPEMRKNTPKLKIGARVSQKMLARLEDLKG